DRGIGRDDPLLQATLAGDAETVGARVVEYRRAGATDLMIGFADFPETTMLERFATRVMPALNAAGGGARPARGHARARRRPAHARAPRTPRGRSTRASRPARRVTRACRAARHRESLRGRGGPVRAPMRARGWPSCYRGRPATPDATRSAAAPRVRRRPRADRAPAAGHRLRARTAQARGPEAAARPRSAAEAAAPCAPPGADGACGRWLDPACGGASWGSGLLSDGRPLRLPVEA